MKFSIFFLLILITLVSCNGDKKKDNNNSSNTSKQESTKQPENQVLEDSSTEVDEEVLVESQFEIDRSLELFTKRDIKHTKLNYGDRYVGERYVTSPGVAERLDWGLPVFHCVKNLDQVDNRNGIFLLPGSDVVIRNWTSYQKNGWFEKSSFQTITCSGKLKKSELLNKTKVDQTRELHALLPLVLDTPIVSYGDKDTFTIFSCIRDLKLSLTKDEDKSINGFMLSLNSRVYFNRNTEYRFRDGTTSNNAGKKVVIKSCDY